MRAMFIKCIVLYVIAGTSASLATANDLVVEITRDDTFSPNIARISSGETIKWAPKVNGHNVEFVKGPAGANLPPKSVLSTNTSMKFVETGVYLYWCTPHKDMGMLGLVVVGNDLSNLKELLEVDMSRQSKSVLRALITSLQ
jgi:pseudoazurin